MDLLAGIIPETMVTSGTLTKLLSTGVQIEDDDADFLLDPKQKDQHQMKFDKNNIDVDMNGNYVHP